MPVAIVTGASKGLGKALATGLAAQGWSVVLDARGQPALDRARDEVRSRLVGAARVTAVAGDVTDAGHRRALTEAAEALGGVDLLVNNASTLGASPLPRTTTISSTPSPRSPSSRRPWPFSGVRPTRAS